MAHFRSAKISMYVRRHLIMPPSRDGWLHQRPNHVNTFTYKHAPQRTKMHVNKWRAIFQASVVDASISLVPVAVPVAVPVPFPFPHRPTSRSLFIFILCFFYKAKSLTFSPLLCVFVGGFLSVFFLLVFFFFFFSGRSFKNFSRLRWFSQSTSIVFEGATFFQL